MNDPEKRICRFCAEVIKAEAKLCPHCRQWLTLKSFRHPVVMILTHAIPSLGILVAMMMALFSFSEAYQNPRPYYSEFPDSLKAGESRMNWVQTSDGLHIFITGVLINTSPITWKDIEFDCRFFDAQGVMVDAGTGYVHFTIRPNDDTAFRVSLVPVAPTNSYDSFKISVGNARNAKGWF